MMKSGGCAQAPDAVESSGASVEPRRLSVRQHRGSRTHRPGRYATAVELVAVFSLSATGARALELPPVGGIGVPGDEGNRFSAFLGAFIGMDSNVLREEPGNEDGDTAVELLGGFAFIFGKDLNKFELRQQIRAERYGELERYDFSESQTLLGVHAAVEKIRFALRVKYASLVEPIDIEITENLERNVIAYVPEVDLSFGMMEVGLGYSARSKTN